ncbi:MarR family winged helix-turn-helix transcriptional regulator [Paenibacillus methanolicus]|uniref:DNA-binding MarR family transcriptional regulator n=1 Tax=Paenibacillus methanolicus TaxID=582686 RepID=A0A5S5BYV1_9BACL|nr:MarR family winged helix-turn-helix transcriptional regulator [Paenibacillus methanolicus]TYP72365.1 DNA-binding MarR family transcriptional regulator [Paenibacillus methanolicus]
MQPALFQLIVQFVANVHQAANELSKAVQLEEVTPVQYKMLEFIKVSQPVTLSHISDCLQMSMPNTSRELRKLSEKELCVKSFDPEDRRKQWIRLTASGESMMNNAFASIEASLAARIGELSVDELEEVAAAIELLQAKVFANPPSNRKD